MKAFLLLFLFIAASANAQNATQTQSQIEGLEKNYVGFYEARYLDIGTLDNLKVQVIYAVDKSGKQLASAVRIQSDGSPPLNGFIDKDEIDGFISDLEHIAKRLGETNTARSGFMRTSSKAGLKISSLYNGSKWSSGILLDPDKPESYFVLKNEKIPELIKQLQEAKKVL